MNTLVGDQWRLSRAEQIRRAMGSEMCAIADSLRSTFGDVKLVWLETQAVTVGTKPEEGVPTHWRGERRRA